MSIWSRSSMFVKGKSEGNKARMGKGYNRKDYKWRGNKARDGKEKWVT